MTIQEQVVLATDKVAHWNSKRDHALAMLTKWQNRLSALQAKEKPQPTAKMLPAVTLVADDKVVPIKRKVEKGQEAAQKALRLLGRNATPLAISAAGFFIHQERNCLCTFSRKTESYPLSHTTRNPECSWYGQLCVMTSNTFGPLRRSKERMIQERDDSKWKESLAQENKHYRVLRDCTSALIQAKNISASRGGRC